MQVIGRQRLDRAHRRFGIWWSEPAKGLALASFVLLGMVRTLTGVSEIVYAVPVAYLCLQALFELPGRRITVARNVGLYVIAGLATSVWLLATSMWTISTGQVFKDTLLVLYWLSILLIVPLVVTPDAVRWVYRSILGAGILTALTVFFAYYSSGTLRGYGTLINDFYLGASSILGASSLALLGRIIGGRRWTFLTGVTLLCLLAALSLSLGRMSLLSTMFLVLLLAIYAILSVVREERGFRRVIKAFLVGTMAVFLVFGLLWGATRVERTAARLHRLFSGVGNELAAGGRGDLWAAAWRGIADAPVFGHGLGSNGIISSGHDTGYPHNMVLQVWVDAGLVGLLFLLVTLAIPVWLFWRERYSSRARLALPFLAMYVFYVLGYQTSLNAYTARPVILMGLLSTWLLSTSSQEWTRDAVRLRTVESTRNRFPIYTRRT